MVKIQYMSDIHLEFGELFLPENSGSDILILAGDILTVHGLMNVDSKKNRYTKFMNHVCSNWEHVLYVPGNHEWYSYKKTDVISQLETFSTQWSNLYLLEMNRIFLEGICFVGGTLWTDFFKGDPVARNAVVRGMNDYHVTALTAEYTEQVHHATRAYIEKSAQESPKVVVVTHHAPSSLSSLPRYAGDILNAGYYSDLSELILSHPAIKAWLHGHMHNTSDYMIGTCRVLANPRGYPHELNPDFDPARILEIGD